MTKEEKIQEVMRRVTGLCVDCRDAGVHGLTAREEEWRANDERINEKLQSLEADLRELIQ